MAHPVLTGHEDPAHFAHAINVAGQVFVPGVHRPVVQPESADVVPVRPLAAFLVAAVGYLQQIAVVQILVIVERFVVPAVAAGRADAVPLGVADAFPEWF